MNKVEVAVASQDILGESPIWCPDTESLFWVDIRAPALCRFHPASGVVRSWPMPELCGGVTRSHPGQMVLSLQSGLFAFDLADAALTPLVALEPASAGNRLNDTKCDRRGRLWVGTMRDYGAAVTGSLYRVDPDLTCTRMLSPIGVPNALCWSPDDRTMYFADTREGRLRAYVYDPDAGTIGAERTLVGAGALPGRPDGATVDADGCIWNARYEGGCVVRITPEGRIDRTIALPAENVTACAFGGPDLRTLFVTTARQRLDADALARQPLAGSVFAIDVGVLGMLEPRFEPISA
jgi:sugar lactone lactonase YvrE